MGSQSPVGADQARRPTGQVRLSRDRRPRAAAGRKARRDARGGQGLRPFVQHDHMVNRGFIDSGHNFLVTRSGHVLEGRHGSLEAIKAGVMVDSADCRTQNHQPDVEHEHVHGEQLTAAQREASLRLHELSAGTPGSSPARSSRTKPSMAPTAPTDSNPALRDSAGPRRPSRALREQGVSCHRIDGAFQSNEVNIGWRLARPPLDRNPHEARRRRTCRPPRYHRRCDPDRPEPRPAARAADQAPAARRRPRHAHLGLRGNGSDSGWV